MYLWAARSVDPATFGQVVAAIALGTVGAGFIDFGSNALWVREVASGRLSEAALGERSVGKVAVAFALSLLWAAITVVVIGSEFLWVAAPIALSLVINQVSQVPLRGAALGERVGLSVLTDRTVAIVTFTALCLLGFEPVAVLWLCLALGSLSASVMGRLMTPQQFRPKVRWRRTNPWRESTFYGVSGLATSAQSLDLPILAAVGGGVPAGIYGSVSRWTQPMGLLAAAFSSASAPFVARSSDARAAWVVLRKGLWLPATAIVLAIAIFVLAPWLVDFLLGNGYAEASGVLQILAMVSIASILSQPLLVGMQSLGRDRFVAIVFGSTVVVQLSAVLVLAVPYGALGAAWASFGAQVILLVALLAGAIGEFNRR